MQFRMHIAYDGTKYHGWQIQPDVRTVEGELTRALATILGNISQPPKVQGASRTDAGVHALGQVAAFGYAGKLQGWDFFRGLNALTDNDICITRIEEIGDSFHARHCARGKIYRYYIWNHRLIHPFDSHRHWHFPHEIDFELLCRAANTLVGVHDFSAYRASDCESQTTIREIFRVDISKSGSMIEIVVEGSAFLKYMVRIMVGTMIDVAIGKLDWERFVNSLDGGVRCDAGRTAPPQGLSLMQVHYPDFPWLDPQPEIGGLHITT